MAATPPLTLTDAAAERVKTLVAAAPEPAVGLRIGVKARGCSGMSYDVQYAKEKGPFDEVVEEKGAVIFIDPGAVLYLIGSRMDYADDSFQSGFVFDNPNAKGTCGCGESFSV